MATKRASHTFTLEPVGDGWYDLLPAGRFGGRDGRGPYINDQPDGVLAAFDALGMPMLIDYHHQSLDAEDKSGAVPAAGWGKALRSDAGRIRCQIEWTAPAQAAIDAKELMYLSPVFDFDESTGRVIQIVCAGLTNLPNLRLAPLTAHSQEHAMNDDLLQALCYALNLPLTSTADEVKGQVDRIFGQGGMATADEAMKKAACALGLPAASTWPEVARAAASRMEPGAMVPRPEYERVSHELAQIKNEQKTAKVDAVVRAAMAAGKIAPFQEGLMREWAGADMERFQKFVDSAPTIVDPGETVPNRVPNSAHARTGAYVPPAGYAVSPESQARHARILDHQKKHGCSYVEAARAVQ